VSPLIYSTAPKNLPQARKVSRPEAVLQTEFNPSKRKALTFLSFFKEKGSAILYVPNK